MAAAQEGAIDSSKAGAQEVKITPKVIAYMTSKVIVKSKNYLVMDEPPTSLSGSGWYMDDFACVPQDRLIPYLKELETKYKSSAKGGQPKDEQTLQTLSFIPSSLEVIALLKAGGIDPFFKPKGERAAQVNVPRIAVVTTLMIRPKTNLVQSKEWFYVGEAKRTGGGNRKRSRSPSE